MSDDRATFEQTKARLDEILVQVRKKDTSLEQSLDLLEEGVRLANACNELIDQTSWRPAEPAVEGAEAGADGDASDVIGAADTVAEAPEGTEPADADAAAEAADGTDRSPVDAGARVPDAWDDGSSDDGEGPEPHGDVTAIEYLEDDERS